MQSYSKYQPDDHLLQVWDRDFEKVWGFKVAVVAQQWRECQKQHREQAVAKSASNSPQHEMKLPQAVVPTVNATTAAVSTSPTTVTAAPNSIPGAQFQYHTAQNGGRRDEPGGQSQYLQKSESDRLAHTYAQAVRNQQRDASLNLPSLKASGLLDSWKPPSEAFATSLSISAPVQPNRDEERRAPPPAPFHLQSNGHPASLARTNVPPSNNVAMPVGLTWLQRESI